jgi:hypothetical protein
MIDAPDREQPRFPAHREVQLGALIAKQMEAWSVGPDDVCLSGGARGADMLFAEIGLQRRARVQLLIALPDEEFVERSVSLPATDYESRYRALRQRCETRFQHLELGPAADADDAFSRNNAWMIEVACAMTDPSQIYALLVWDEKPAGDGPGGTSDFMARIQNMGGEIAVINPTLL